MAERGLANVMGDRACQHDVTDISGRDTLDGAMAQQVLACKLAKAPANAADLDRMCQAVADIIAGLG